jgi:hypothetical protein
MVSPKSIKEVSRKDPTRNKNLASFDDVNRNSLSAGSEANCWLLRELFFSRLSRPGSSKAVAGLWCLFSASGKTTCSAPLATNAMTFWREGMPRPGPPIDLFFDSVSLENGSGPDHLAGWSRISVLFRLLVCLP